MGRRKGQSDPGQRARDLQGCTLWEACSWPRTLFLGLLLVPPLRLSGCIPAVVPEGSGGSLRGRGSSSQKRCAVLHPSDGKRPPFMTKLSGRHTGQMVSVPSSRPGASAWHDHTLCLPEAAEARPGSAPRGWGYVGTFVCVRECGGLGSGGERRQSSRTTAQQAKACFVVKCSISLSFTGQD